MHSNKVKYITASYNDQYAILKNVNQKNVLRRLHILLNQRWRNMGTSCYMLHA